MTQVIKKFILTQGIQNGTFPVTMPTNSKILSVGLDINHTPTLIALVNPDTELEERYFEIFGIDQELPIGPNIHRNFIGCHNERSYSLCIFERL